MQNFYMARRRVLKETLYTNVSMFRSRCLKGGFVFKEGSNLSHVLMDGGSNSRLSVPFDRLNEFYSIYVDCVKSGERVCLVEQKTDTFNFFVDLDYKDTEDIPFERLEEYMHDETRSKGSICGAIQVGPTRASAVRDPRQILTLRENGPIQETFSS